jgi:hypothetical protein
VLVDGGVSCWGTDGDSAPRRLAGITDAVDVSLGSEIAVLRADGSVATFADRFPRTVARPLAVTGIQSLAQGDLAACAVRVGGTVSCWLKGLHAQGSAAELPAVEVRGIAGAVAVGVGDTTGCALLKDGRLACFPLTGPGRPTSALLAGFNDLVEIQVGSAMVCGRDARGDVACFVFGPRVLQPIKIGTMGVFGLSQIGEDSPLVCRNDPAGVVCERPLQGSNAVGLDDEYPRDAHGLVPGAKGPVLKQIVASNSTACSLDDHGVVRCWGKNVDALLGQPFSSTIEQPVLVPGLPAMRSIAAADSFTCGLSTGGQVLCWAPYQEQAPTQAAASPVAGLVGIERLVAGRNFACAFSPTAEVSCFSGRPLGGPRTPVRVPALDGMRAIAFASDVGPAVAVIDRAGELRVGENPGGQTLAPLALVGIGSATTARRIAAAREGVLTQDQQGNVYYVEVTQNSVGTPQRQRDLDGALDLSSSGMALLPGGKIVYTKLRGDSRTVAASSPLVSLSDRWDPCGSTATGAFGCLEAGEFHELFAAPKQVTSSFSHSCALDEAGLVRCVGSNRYGECGVSVGLSRSLAPVEVRLR